jgi:hypothetical protein
MAIVPFLTGFWNCKDEHASDAARARTQLSFNAKEKTDEPQYEG